MRLLINRTDCSYEASKTGHNKFEGDNFIVDNENYFVLISGVNLRFTSKSIETNYKYIIDQYLKKEDTFFNDFRGSFSGVLFDKQNNKWLIYTNHIGDQKLYYHASKDSVLINSSIFDLTESLKKQGAQISLNKEASYFLLSYGYFPEDYTIIEDVKRLTAGKYLKLENNKISVLQYYEITNSPNNSLSQSDYIEALDSLFREAISLEYDKDLIYGYKHIAALSGGLDCRMTNWVAHVMGYSDITNITFSQNGYLDMTIAQEISSFLNHKWLFYSLNNGMFLFDIDKITGLVNAQVSYANSAHSAAMNNLINFSEFGVLHSGQLGDVTIGTYNPKDAYEKATNIKASSKLLLHKVNYQMGTFPNKEIANYSIRGFNGILTGNFTAHPYTEVTSPFLYPEFIDFCLSIPLKLRANHHIYKKWILNKYPEAARFKWESIGTKITSKSVVIRSKNIPVKRLPKFVLEGLKYNLGINGKPSKQSMNPFDYWLKHNTNLGVYYNNYFKKNIDQILDSELRADCLKLFKEGSALEKTQVLTLLSAAKQINA